MRDKKSTHTRVSLETKDFLIKLRKEFKTKEDELIQYALLKAFKKR